MRALVQRTRGASVAVGGDTVGQIETGLLIFICAMQGDSKTDARALAAKTSRLRIFRDEQGKMNRSLLDTGGAALVISQFTLAADTSRGNRPGFSAAAPPELGRALYNCFITELTGTGVPVESGVFGAEMAVSLVNDGPVTIWLQT